MLIGAQLYTVREFTKTEKAIEETFQKIAAIGYTCAQVSALGPIAPEKLRDIAAENKLDIIITHTDEGRIRNETEKVIEEHRIFGCSHIGIGYMPKRYHGSLEGCRAFIRDFTAAAQKIADSGMKLHYHNHAFEFEKFGGSVLYDVLINETSPDLWGFIPDTYWIAIGGRNPAKQLENLKGRVTVCHFKDLAIVQEQQRMAPIMEGNLAWGDIFRACEKMGIEYAMVEQDDTYELEPFDALRVSYDNLRKAGYR